MNKSVSLIISSVFHPVFVNLMGLMSLFVLSPYLRLGVNENAKLFYILFIFISSGIVPVVMVLLLKMLGKVQSVLLDVQEERNIPYLITASIYLIDYYFLSQSQHTPTLIRAYVLACACIVVAVVIVNHFYKISVHGASLGALTGVIISTSFFSTIDIRYLLAGVFIVSGITLSARLFLYAHTFGQVITGWLLGFVVIYTIL
jgi:hypothetical protein